MLPSPSHSTVLPSPVRGRRALRPGRLQPSWGERMRFGTSGLALPCPLCSSGCVTGQPPDLLQLALTCKMRLTQTHRLYSAWLHLRNEMLDKTNCKDRPTVAPGVRAGVGEGLTTKGKFGGAELFCISIMVVAQLDTFMKTHDQLHRKR